MPAAPDVPQIALPSEASPFHREYRAVADAYDAVLGILVMPEGGDAESGGGPGFFPDLPV